MIPTLMETVPPFVAVCVGGARPGPKPQDANAAVREEW